MTASNRVFLWLAPAAAFAAAFGFSLSSSSLQKPRIPAVASSHPDSPPSIAPTTPAASVPPIPAQSEAKPRTKTWSHDEFAEAVNFPSTLHRRWAVKRLFDALSLDQFPTALAEIERSTAPLDVDLKMMLFRSWAQDAPDAALRSGPR